MGDRFRSMIDSEFAEEVPPPIGDLVDNAIRDGQRLRRARVVQRSVACFAAVGVLVLGVGMATSTLRTESPPGSGFGAAQEALPASPPLASPVPTGTNASSGLLLPPDTPTMAVQPGAQDNTRSKPSLVQPAVVLLALQGALPDGSMLAYAGSRYDSFTGVQVFLDRGSGFGMVRVAMARDGSNPKRSCSAGPTGVEVSCEEEGGALVERFEIDANCVQRRGANIYRQDGVTIQVNVGSCLVDGEWGTPGALAIDENVLTLDEAVRIGLNTVWDERSLERTAAKADDAFPKLPPLASFDGVGP